MTRTPPNPRGSWVFLSALTLALAPGTATAQDAFSDIATLFQDALKQWRVPGLAVVIVQDDRVLLRQGFGVRELGQDAPVTPDTVFPLASCTKPFTSLALAMLADERKLSWDDPVRRHVPYFHLADPLADAAVTLRDLLCHRTGVGPHEPLWYRAPWSLEERIRKAGRLELSEPFRAGFQYQAILFGAAGVAAGRAAGTSWADLVQHRVLAPLGMKNAAPTFPGARAELAVGHRKDDDGAVRVVPRYPLDQPDPAGSLHASARDLEPFLRLQLDGGQWQGRRLVSAANLAETHRPHAIIRLEGFAEVMNPETRFLTYGLGWIVQDYRGKRILMHGGAIDGFRAHFTLVPEERIGIALLNNLDGSFMNLALSNRLLDIYFGAPYRDWNAHYLKMHADEKAAQQERARRLREHRRSPPLLPLADHAGTYRDPAYGDCTVELRDGRLHWRWSCLDCPLEAFDGNTFRVNQPALDTLFRFDVVDGRVRSLEALGRVFRRVAP